MRRLFTTFVMFAALAIGSQAQVITTSQPLNKNVVLEEYTGIHCVYCPQGHAIAESILESNPGRAAVIAVHQGSFASPSTGEPDYRTPFGDPLAAQTGLTGYPSGTVNRHIFTGSSTALGRGDWTANSNVILAQASPVNIGVTSVCDTVTRQLTVTVELYYTAASAVPTNYINVALIQNNVYGPQTGGNAGNNYKHMHMLRYLVTDQWGDAVNTTTAGTVVTRTYNYTIPQAYNNIPCVIRNCQIVAFVSESHQEILTGDVVDAVNGTNLFIGDITTAGSKMKLGQPNAPTTFELTANSNITGPSQFKIKLIANDPADWSASFGINGQYYSDSVIVTLEKGTPKPIVLAVTPGYTPGFHDYTFALSSVTNPNAPVKYFTVSVLSNVHTLVVNAAGDNYATQFQGVYVDGLTAAGCDHLATMKSSTFVDAKNAGILTEIINVFYNVSWTFPAFTDAEALACQSFVDSGKNLFVAGQDIGWDIMSGQAGYHGTPVTKNFYTTYLKAQYMADGSSTNNKLVANVSDAIYGTVATSNIVDVFGGNMYPDEIKPISDATTTFYYNTTLTKIAAIRSMTSSAKVVYFGFGLEMVQTVDVRNDILNKTYDWFMVGVGMNEKKSLSSGHLGLSFPSPASDQATIRLSGISHDMQVEVTDISGRILMTSPVKANDEQLKINTSGFANGIYLYRLVSGEKVIESKKLVIQK